MQEPDPFPVFLLSSSGRLRGMNSFRFNHGGATVKRNTRDTEFPVHLILF